MKFFLGVGISFIASYILVYHHGFTDAGVVIVGSIYITAGILIGYDINDYK